MNPPDNGSAFTLRALSAFYQSLAHFLLRTFVLYISFIVRYVFVPSFSHFFSSPRSSSNLTLCHGHVFVALGISLFSLLSS
mmetsp:Transcript_51809/g.130059  ORF Transcript_51809/g.130059 Transcript_51809/m.130059 type:complete len:81 (-) Transcript_51809:29-271(-)